MLVLVGFGRKAVDEDGKGLAAPVHVEDQTGAGV